jgi:hypothetical protein
MIYDLYLETALVPKADTFVEAGVAFTFFGTADCSGPSSGTSSPKLIDQMAPGWQVLEDVVRPPQGTASFLIRLVVVKPFEQSASQAQFDNILLKAR